MDSPCPLLDLPPEVLSVLLRHLHVDSFIHLTQTCKHLFEVGRGSRDAILQHLDALPGIKLGLNSLNIPTSELYTRLRQRASLNLVGTSHDADCQLVKFANGTLVPRASCLTDDADYFNLSLVLKESGIVRHYGPLLQNITETTPFPYADGTGKILFVVHRKSTVSILYAWKPEEPVYKADEHSVMQSPSRLPSEDPEDVQLTPNESLPAPALSKPPPSRTEYHLVHYSAYNSSRPDFYIVPSPMNCKSAQLNDDLEPIHLAVHSRLKCAIIWRNRCVVAKMRSRKDHRPYPDTIITLCLAERAPIHEVGRYVTRIVLPQKRAPSQIRDGSSEREEPESELVSRDWDLRFKARACEFVQDGKRLKLYSTGMLAPYAGLAVRTNLSDRAEPEFTSMNFNLNSIDGVCMRTETPFYGAHVRGTNTVQGTLDFSLCVQSYLQLAIESGEKTYRTSTTFDTPSEDGLYIIQSHDTISSLDCDHEISPEQYVLNQTDESQRVVAQLRGWSKYWCPSNLTALDMLVASKKGTRIAFAMWDHVLVYVLDPAILAENWIAQDEADDASQASDQDTTSSQTSSNVNSQASNQDAQSQPAVAPVPQSPKERYKINDRAMIKAARYYDLVDHPKFGEIVELWPIVLKLPQGAVARKMMWRGARDEVSDADRAHWSYTSEDDSHSDSNHTNIPEQPGHREAPAVDVDMDHHSSLEGSPPRVLSQPKIKSPSRQIMSPRIPSPPRQLRRASSSDDGLLSPFEAIAKAKSAAYESIESQKHRTEDMQDEDVDSDDSLRKILSDPLPADNENTESEVERISPNLPVDGDGDVDMSICAGYGSEHRPSPHQGIVREGKPSNITTASAQHHHKTADVDTLNPFVPIDQAPDSGATDLSATPAAPKPSISEHDLDLAPEPQQPTLADLLASTTTPASPTTDSDLATHPILKGKQKRKSPSSSHSDEHEHETAAANDSSSNDDDLETSRPQDRRRQRQRQRRRRKRSRPRRKRNTEDELIILTDRGVQIWNLGALAQGKRGWRVLSEREGGFAW